MSSRIEVTIGICAWEDLAGEYGVWLCQTLAMLIYTVSQKRPPVIF